MLYINLPFLCRRILGRRRRLSLRGGIRQEKGEEGIEVPTGGGRNGGADNAEIDL